MLLGGVLEATTSTAVKLAKGCHLNIFWREVRWACTLSFERFLAVEKANWFARFVVQSARSVRFCPNEFHNDTSDDGSVGEIRHQFQRPRPFIVFHHWYHLVGFVNCVGGDGVRSDNLNELKSIIVFIRNRFHLRHAFKVCCAPLPI